MQATFEGVLLRKLNHAIHIRDRARNVLISHCHLHDNRGAGIFLDHVDLHQIIVTASHLSYCKRGGIKIIGSQIRNLQITGTDIEYNFDEECGPLRRYLDRHQRRIRHSPRRHHIGQHHPGKTLAWRREYIDDRPLSPDE